MLKWVSGVSRRTKLRTGARWFFAFMCFYCDFTRVFLLRATHVLVRFGIKGFKKKEIILIACLCVNKMAFLGRGCGELRSRLPGYHSW